MIDANNLIKVLEKFPISKEIFDLFGQKNIFFVGGAVRDHLLKKPLNDIDLVVKFNVNSVKKKLNKS